MAIDLSNPMAIRTGVRNAIQSALDEVLGHGAVLITDIFGQAISDEFNATGVNRRYFLTFLSRVRDFIQAELPDGIVLKDRTDKYKASMTFSEMIKKLSVTLSKLNQDQG